MLSSARSSIVAIVLAITALGASVVRPAPIDLTPTGCVAKANPLPPGAVAGHVTGRVSFEGERPEVKPLDMPAEKTAGCSKDGKPIDNTDQTLLIDKDGGLKNVVVSIEAADAKVVVPEKPIDLDQASCHYEPHVLVIPAGSTVNFRNSDAVGHNVHSTAEKNPSFNETVVAGSSRPQKYDKADRVRVTCDIHPWMGAWLIVSETPYIAVTDAEGKFAIEGLAPGEYTIKFWHERLGKGEAKATVKADGSSDAIDFKLGAESKGARKKR